jgi:hypothetical protein
MEIVGWVFDYDFTGTIEFMGEITNCSDYNWDFGVDVKTSGANIVGLRITIKQSDFEYAQRRSKIYADNLKNYSIIKSGIANNLSLSGYQDIPKIW